MSCSYIARLPFARTIFALEEWAVGSEEAPRRAGLRSPLKQPVRFSRTPLSQRRLSEGSRKEPDLTIALVNQS